MPRKITERGSSLCPHVLQRPHLTSLTLSRIDLLPSAPHPVMQVGHINLLASSREEARAKLGQLDPAGLASLRKTTVAAAAAGLGGGAAGGPKVGIIMGSDSDLATMKAAAQVRRFSREVSCASSWV